ncbi:MAG: hypothetical protein RIS70_1431 [Planctomycetota bacterium]
MSEAEITINTSEDGRGFRLETAVWLPQPRERLFEFFGDAFQLQSITPPWLHFEVLTPAPIQMAAGTLIDYRLRLRIVPLRWRTLISEWNPPHSFVDEQLKGPYRWWRHRHEFVPESEGTTMRDIVDYGVPGGRIIHAMLVRNDLAAIFAYRRQRMIELFGPQNELHTGR